MEELQQAYFKLADFLGDLKSKILGGGPRPAGGSVSVLNPAAQPLIPVSLTIDQGWDSPSADELRMDNAVGDIAMYEIGEGDTEGGGALAVLRFEQLSEQDFELPTASQMPLR